MRPDGTPMLAGIVSFDSIEECDLDIPAVFTRVHSFLEWIKAKSGIYNS